MLACKDVLAYGATYLSIQSKHPVDVCVEAISIPKYAKEPSGEWFCADAAR